MPLQHAVLALLARGESYGYELKPAFERAVGPQWGELNIGQLYQILDRLSREGMVAGERVPQDNRPDKTIYRLTAAGRDELGRWLEAPSTRRAGYRDDFFLKLFAAARLGEGELRELLARRRVELLGELRALSELRRDHHGEPLVALLVEAAIVGARGALEVADRAAERAAGLVSAARQAAPGTEAPPDHAVGERQDPHGNVSGGSG